MSFVLVTVLLDVMGIGLIIPVLPALVGEFTGTRDSLAFWYGVLGAAYGLMQFLVAPLLGALSDQFGRRKILLVALTGLGTSLLLQGFATSLAMLFAARLISGATAATISVSSAYVADVTTVENRSRGFGLIGAMFGLGFIIGPVVGGLVGDIHHRWPFFMAAGLCFLNVLFGLFVLPESLPLDRRTRFSLARANPLSALRGLRDAKGIGALVLAFAFTNLAQFILHSVWVLYTETRFGWTPSQNGLALFLVGVTGVVVQGYLLSRIVARWGEQRAVLVGMVFGTLAFLSYGLATAGGVLLATIVVTFLSGLAAPALKSMISKGFDARRQGITMGALDSINGMMTVIGPLLGSLILAQVTHLPADDWRMGSSFFLSALLQATSLFLVWRWTIGASGRSHNRLGHRNP